MKLKAIIKGWENYIFTNEETEKKAIERAKICSKCPHAKKGTYETLLPDYTLKKVKGMKCNVCGCPLSTLLRQNEKQCELNKWNDEKPIRNLKTD